MIFAKGAQSRGSFVQRALNSALQGVRQRRAAGRSRLLLVVVEVSWVRRCEFRELSERGRRRLIELLK